MEMDTCGHVKPCLELCDDFVDKLQGLCYVKAFHDRSAAFSTLGFFPPVEKLFLALQHEVEVIPFYLVNMGTHLHVTLEDGIADETIEILMRCASCNISGTKHSGLYPTRDILCKRCSSRLDLIALPANSCLGKRVGSTLPEFLILGGDSSVVNEYSTDGIVRRTLSAMRDKDDILIMCENTEIKRFPIESDELKTMRHDYIAGEWSMGTDMPLSTLGVPLPEGKLTPDYIDVSQRTILELGTVNSNHLRPVKQTFNDKMLKYSDIASRYDAIVYVLSVGINKVVSNLNLPQFVVQLLTSRFLEIQPLEREISMLCGFDPFKMLGNDDYKLAKLVFEKVSLTPLHSKQYDIHEIQSFSCEMTSKEKDEATAILQQELMAASRPPTWSRRMLDDYLLGFTSDNSKVDKKRICNIPMVIPTENAQPIKIVKGDGPKYLLDLWAQSAVVHSTSTSLSEKREDIMRNEEPSQKHLKKTQSMFRAKLSADQEKELALQGIGGKLFDQDPDKIAIEASSKKSFSPESDISDIEDFLKLPLLEPLQNLWVGDTVSQAVITSKLLSTMSLPQDSVKIWEHWNNTKLMTFCYFISYIFMELSYNYKHWTNKGLFIRKDLKNGVSLLIYNPKGHLFVSYCIPKTNAVILETGRIGPRLYDCSDYWISDFCSYNEPTIEHFIKCGPYIGSLLIHLQSACETNPIVQTTYSEQSVKSLLLVYLNNKTDIEELITSQRYLFMKLLEDVNPNPWGFVERLPSVLRSRLTVYYLWRTINLMDKYSEQKILKIPYYSGDMILYDYKNISSLFADIEVSLPQKVNEFYYGYVVSKERGRGGSRMFKVLTKILENEYQFRDAEVEAFTSSMKTPKFSSHRSLLKFFGHSFKEILTSKLGQNYQKTLYNNFLEEAAYSNFGVLATLKASSRKHPQTFNLNGELDNKTVSQIHDILMKSNPEESKKRPKMIESIITLVADFKAQHNRDPKHVVELLPWCLSNLVSKGYFDSDCFPKPQHGGDREIHVLEVSARIVQFYIEMFSKVLCKYFPSETTCNPDTKDFFVKDHYSKSRSSLGTFNVHSKSADASKWCQAHHTSHFAAMIEVVAPEELKPFLHTALSLWPKKRLSFPLDLTAVLIHNRDMKTGSLFSRFKTEHQLGSGIFTQRLGNKIEIQSGMFQGILHRTSSLYHTMIQEVCKRLVENLINHRLMKQCHVSIVQGSDDSGMMISLQGPLSIQGMRLCKTLLLWKEYIAAHVSIYTNLCKTSSGTHDLIEYNSEWHSRHKIIKPTFRWVSACMEISVNERFIDRLRIFNNILSQCLEGGATTLECSVIQLNQCAMHYILLGFQTQDTSDMVWSELSQYPDPVCGFFPCDFDIAAGVTGVEFQLYNLYLGTPYGGSLRDRLSTDSQLSYSPDELPPYLKVKDLQSAKLKFSNMSIFQSFIRKLPLETYENAVQEIENDPLLLFGRHTSWAEDQPNLVLKVFSPGVKESISNMSPLLRMAASSSYVQNRPCFTLRGDSTKYNLWMLIKTIKSLAQSKPKEHEVFPLHSEFRRVRDMILEITRSSVLQDVVMKKTSKSKIVVFEVPGQEFPLIELCKRKWFGLGHIPLSSSQFRQKWEETMVRYEFLSAIDGLDGLHATCASLKMSVVECKSFIESLSSRTRSVVLYDSSSKSKSLSNSLSRIYWPNTKVHHLSESNGEISRLRSHIFSLSSYWCSTKKKEDLLTKWLLECPQLHQVSTNIPPKGQKLKVFHDYLIGDSKTSLLSKIMALKQGSVGCFTSRQKGYGVHREGKGVWIGIVCGTPVLLEIEGDICTKIILKNMIESITLAKSIKRLISEFSCVIGTNNTPGVKLTEKGVFSPGVGTAIQINPNLEFKYANRIEEYDWKLTLSDYNLRLVVIDEASGRRLEYTMLSDSFVSKDWLEDCVVDIGDPLLAKWSRGELCLASELSVNVAKFIPSRRSEFLKFTKRLKQSPSLGVFNYEALRQALIGAFKLKIHKNRVQTPHMSDPEIMNIYSQVMSMDFADEDEDDWANMMESGESDIVQKMSDSDMDDLKDIIDMLNTVDKDEPFLEEVESSRIMPYSIRFFSNLNTLSSAQEGCDFQTLCDLCAKNENKVVAGLLGKIVSLVLKEFHIANEIDDFLEVADLEMTASILSDSIKSEADLDKINLEDVKAKIDLIDSYINSSRDKPSESLLMSKKRYETILGLISRSAPSSSLNYDELMPQIAKIIKQKQLKFHDQFPSLESLHATILSSLLCSEHNTAYLTLPEYDQARIQSALTNHTMSSSLSNLIINTFEDPDISNIFFRSSF